MSLFRTHWGKKNYCFIFKLLNPDCKALNEQRVSLFISLLSFGDPPYFCNPDLVDLPFSIITLHYDNLGIGQFRVGFLSLGAWRRSFGVEVHNPQVTKVRNTEKHWFTGRKKAWKSVYLSLSIPTYLPTDLHGKYKLDSTNQSD